MSTAPWYKFPINVDIIVCSSGWSVPGPRYYTVRKKEVPSVVAHTSKWLLFSVLIEPTTFENAPEKLTAKRPF